MRCIQEEGLNFAENVVEYTALSISSRIVKIPKDRIITTSVE